MVQSRVESGTVISHISTALSPIVVGDDQRVLVKVVKLLALGRGGVSDGTFRPVHTVRLILNVRIYPILHLSILSVTHYICRFLNKSIRFPQSL